MAERLSPLARDIELLFAEELSEEAKGRALTEYATQALREGEAVNQRALGYVPDHDTFVDGGKRESLDRLTGSSRVMFEFHLLVDVIEYVDEQLILHSPVRSERYARSHVWFADDAEMDPRKPPPAEEYVVLNAQPYARKIERGLSPQAPDGVYEGVAALAKRRYGNVAYVGFSYRSFPGGAVGKWAQSASAQELARNVRGGSPHLRADWLTRQPCIKIDPGR
jgi:hypothetical protein